MRAGRPLAGLALTALAAAGVLAIVAEWRSALNSDAAWILEMAGRVLQGTPLYRGTLEINPPLIVWLNLPVVALSGLLGIDAAALLRIIAYAGIAGSALATGALLRRAHDPPGGRGTPVPAIAVAAVLLLLPLGGFAEREHFITMLLLPLLALTAARMAGASISLRSAVAAGLAGAVAIALKPYFLVLWLLLVLVRWGTRRSASIAAEDLVILGGGAIYLLAVLWITPDYLSLVRLLAPAYARYSVTPPAEALLKSPEAWCTAGAVVAWWVRRRGPPDPVGRVLLAACLGSLIAALLQGKGWFYHFYPLAAFSVLLAVHAAALPARPGSQGWQRLARAAALAVFVLASAPLWFRMWRVTRLRAGGLAYARNREIHDLLILFGAQHGAQSIEVLSTDITPTFPLVHLAGLTDAQRLPHLWLPTTIYRSTRAPGRPVAFNPPGRMGRAERITFDAVAGEVVHLGPDLLLVESRARNEARYGYPGGFDHIAYYSQDTAFSRVMRSYVPAGSSHGFNLFRRSSGVSAPR